MNKNLKLILYYSSECKPIESPANRGFNEVDKLWKKLPKNINKEIIDTKNMDEEELGKIYSRSWYPSVFTKKYKIRQVFGSRKRSGCFFAKEVPALFVYKDIEYPIDVYPHEEKGGKIVTIDKFLEKLEDSKMEVELVEFKKSLYELDKAENQQNAEDLKKWESNFWKYIEVYKSKYSWCKKEFDDIHSLKGSKGFWSDDKEMIPPKNSVRGYIDSYKKLFIRIKDFNSLE